ncbi:Eha [Sulfuriferula multivorans]|uniref:Eha n=1 Tax=Sulfuriferula multivorans TaxID=1559896 RepID=A0A401JF35_9PROT|nr:AAA family ATPase [Sulfuriferula multivorans]GBL46242.1 Eha [Sulfuriferula multivorans]
MSQPAFRHQELEYMPLKLKSIMARANLSQHDLVKRMPAGLRGPTCRPTVSRILNWDEWPVNIDRDSIVEAVEALLREAHVSEADIAQAWQPDSPEVRYLHPKFKSKPPLGDDPMIHRKEALTEQARKHWRLFKDPFTDDINAPEDVFLADDQRYVREVMYSAARHGRFVAIVGESGSGKTTLRRDMIDRIRRERLPIQVIQPRTIDKNTLTAGAICDAIVLDMQPHAKLRRTLEGKAREVERLLTESSQGGYSHVLMIEESHDLSVSTLKFLKRFWELEDGFKKLLAIILIGQPEMKNRLDERNFEVREVVRRCELVELLPLDGKLEEYLTHKLQRAGVDYAKVFAPGAADAALAKLIQKVGKHDYVSMAYPLEVNNLTTRALNAAAAIGATSIDADLIKEL